LLDLVEQCFHKVAYKLVATFGTNLIDSLDQVMSSQCVLLVEYIFTDGISDLSITNAQRLSTIVKLSKLTDGFEVLANIAIARVLLKERNCVDYTLAGADIVENAIILNHPLDV
jgi:hypothetical protein